MEFEFVWLFQHTAARRRLGLQVRRLTPTECFNTQPPEGGWKVVVSSMFFRFMFQHTAARRRLVRIIVRFYIAFKFQHTAARRRLVAADGTRWKRQIVSTHSRPKAAGAVYLPPMRAIAGFNTQPPEGGWCRHIINGLYPRSFNTQPPEGGWRRVRPPSAQRRRFNTQPPEGGWPTKPPSKPSTAWFQHTAARRRLDKFSSKTKAIQYCFNTQPPEGGWG